MRRALGAAAAAFVALAIAGACGDVPTLPKGVAFITPIQLPSPTVAAGDTMRDSTGRAMPLRVIAIGRDSSDTIRDVTLRYILTSLHSGASITDAGYLVAPDSLQTLRIVAQVTDGSTSSSLKLQTPEITVDVVPLADSMTAGAPVRAAVDTAAGLPVTVTGTRGTAHVGAGGIRVHYRIAAVYPSQAASLYFLADDAGRALRPDSTIALDTTSSAGTASRSIHGLASVVDGVSADSIVITATATSQKGQPLAGSPVRFLVKIKKS